MARIDGDLPVLAFANADAFDRWLATHAESRGAWLKFAKKGRTETISKREAIDCALCQGWIDGQLGRGDEDYFVARFTPRKASGRWSAINVQRAEALIALGRMKVRGLQEVQAAQADGRWQAAYPSAATAEPPEDFLAALLRNPRAAALFGALDGANRYAVLYRLHHTKPDARERRIADVVAMLERGETFHPQTKATRRQRGSSDKTRRGASGNSTPS